jgi:hypothetical protein
MLKQESIQATGKESSSLSTHTRINPVLQRAFGCGLWVDGSLRCRNRSIWVSIRTSGMDEQMRLFARENCRFIADQCENYLIFETTESIIRAEDFHTNPQ